MPNHPLEQIRELLEAGKHLKARHLLKSFLKRKRPSLEERILISEYWLRLGDPLVALKTLQSANVRNDPELNTSEARLLNLLGAEKASLRRLYPVPDLKALSPSHLRTAAEVHLTRYEFEKALPFARELATREGRPRDYRYFFDLILHADILEGFGETQEALQTIQMVLTAAEVRGSLLEAIALQARGEYLIKSDEKPAFQEIESDFILSSKILTAENRTKDRALLLKWMGALKVLQNDRQGARTFLEESLELLIQTKSRSMGLIEVFHWLSQTRPLALKEQLLFNFSAIESPWKPKFFGNAVLVKEGRAESMDYGRYSEKVEWDLGAPSSFNSIDKQLCYILVTEGSFGIGFASLIDRLYDFDFVSYEQGVRRLEARLSRIQSFLKLRREKNWLHLEKLPQSCLLIHPDHIAESELLWLRKMNCDFSVEDVGKLLHLSVSAARQRIHQWKSNGLYKRFAR